MATQQSSIVVDVQGTQELRSLNTSLNTYKKHIAEIITLHQQLATTTNTLNINVNGLTSGQAKLLVSYAKQQTALQQLIKTNTDHLKNIERAVIGTNQLTNSLQRQINVLQNFANKQQGQIDKLRQTTAELKNQNAAIQQNIRGNNQNSFSLSNMFLQYIKFRAVAGILQGIVSLTQQAVEATKDYNLQTARTTRVIGSQGTNQAYVKSSLEYGTAYSGRSIQDVGETMYQLGTFVSRADGLTSAFNSTLKLLVGTEGDARETTRTVVQLYEQFGDTLGTNLTNGEKFQRINNLLALSFKDANAEIGEISNSLKYLGPIASAAHVPLAQVTAVINTLTASGQRGRMSGTSVAQFITELLKNYNHDEGGVVKNGMVYKFKLETDKEGNLDLVRTLHNIVNTARTLPTDKATEFLRVVAGTQNAFRFLGTQGAATMAMLDRELQRSIGALNGNASALNRLHGEMNETFSQAGARAWNVVLSEMVTTVDSIAKNIGLIGAFNSIADRGTVNKAYEVANQDLDATIRSEDPIVHTKRMIQITNMAVATMQSKQARERNIPANKWTDRNSYDPDATMGDSDFLIRDQSIMEHALHSDSHGTMLPTELNAIKAMVHSMGADQKVNLGSLYQWQGFLAQDLSKYQTAGHANNVEGGTVQAMVRAEARRQGVPENLALGVAKQESSFHQSAVSRTGAIGVMQLMPGTAAGLGVNPRDTKQNIQGGVKYLAEQLKHYGNVDDALAAYNGGDVAVRRMHAGSPIGETTDYLAKVKMYAADFGSDSVDGVSESPIAKSKARLEKEHEKAVREAEKRKQLQIKGLESEKSVLNVQAEYYASGKGGPNSQAKLAALDFPITKLTEMIANLQNDAETKERLRLGMSVLGDKTKDLISKANDQSKIFIESAFDKDKDTLGIWSIQTLADAARLTMAEMVEASGKGDNANAAKAKNAGPLFKLMQERAKEQDEFERTSGEDYYASTFQGISDKDKLGYAFSKGFVKKSTMDQLASKHIKPVDQAFSASLAASEAGRRPASMFRNQVADEISQVTSDIGANKTAYNKLASDAIVSQTDVGKAKMAGFAEEIERLNRTLTDIDDKQVVDRFDRSLTVIAQKYEDQRNALGLGAYQRVGEDDDDFKKRQRSNMGAVGQSYVGQIAELQSKLATPGLSQDARDKIQTDIRSANQNIVKNTDDMAKNSSEELRQKYEEAKQTADGVINKLFDSIRTGKNILGAVGDVGTAINDAHIKAFFDPMLEPLITSLTQQLVSTDSNTVATNALTKAMGGEVPPGATPTSTGKGGSPGGKSRGNFANTNIGMGLAAYSVLQNGMQNGPVSGAINGIMAGATYGPVGMAIGGAVGLIGGLFGGHKKDPLAESKNHDPALYNAPGDMLWNAYRYRATGGVMPNDLNVKDWRKSAPIVNVFMDGVKVAVQTQLSQQGSTGMASQTNSSYNFGSPI